MTYTYCTHVPKSGQYFTTRSSLDRHEFRQAVRGATKKQGDTNSRVQSGYDVPMYPKAPLYIPLQGLDRRALADSESHIRSPLSNWSPPLAPFHQS